MSIINGIAVINGIGTLNGKGYVNGVAPGGVAVPSAPTGLTPTGGTGSISLAFTLVSGATSYNVLISADGGSTYPTTVTGVTTSPYVDSTATSHFLATTGQVFYKMQAVNSAGTSASSTAVNASPFSFYDTFTGSVNDELSSHQLTIGPAGYTFSAGADWQIRPSSGSAELVSNNASDAAYINVGINDCTVSLTMTSATTGSGYAGIALRYQDTTNYYAFVANHGDANYYLKQNIAGVSSNVVAQAGGPIKNGDVIKMVCSGNNITAFINGVQVYTYASATQFHSVNNFGLFQGARDTTGQFSNLKITIP